MRVTVIDLIDQPGSSRPVRDVVAVEEFGEEPWGRAEGALRDAVELDLQLDSVVDGILVRGTVGFALDLDCARCLAPQQRTLEATVTELFVDPARQDEGDEPEPGYELLDAASALDLSTLVRDALLIDLPLRILCADDCQGLCPTCGGDRNARDCGHTDDAGTDPRWAALADLDVPPE